MTIIVRKKLTELFDVFFKLVLKYVNEFLPPVELTWSPTSSSDLSDSYVICQMKWYHIKISKKDNTLKMIVNGGVEVMTSVSDTTAINGTVLLGQPLGIGYGLH